MKAEIGIIGFGSFGELAARHFKEKAEVFVTDTLNKEKEAKEIGVRFTSLNEVLKRKIIILSVPMENLQDILEKIKNKLKRGTLVLDVCSLKTFSCKLMRKMLPGNIEIIGTHPLFGPNSAPGSLKGLKIALCNISASKRTINNVKKFCESLKLKVFITTPKEHDRQMAVSQALTHFIGQALKNAKIKRVELSTRTFDKLMDIVEMISHNTPALFKNMQTMNSFAKEARERFLTELNKIEANLR